MKLTKSKLKQIIKEELQNVLKEYGPMKSKRLFRQAYEQNPDGWEEHLADVQRVLQGD